VKVMYPNMWELMLDLRDMGESNAVLGRCVPLRLFDEESIYFITVGRRSFAETPF
jgi:hypothetical protein